MKLFYRTLAAAIAALAFLVLSPLAVVSTTAEMVAPALFGPLSATMSLTLDRITAHLQAEAQGLSTAFKAFIERSLTHDEFSNGQFGAGRMLI